MASIACQHHVSWIVEVDPGIHQCILCMERVDKKQITPLTLGFAWTLYREGPEGWLKRANTLMQLASNTQQLGLVLRGEYLHLSRSLTAMVATLGGLYEGVPRWRAAPSPRWRISSRSRTRCCGTVCSRILLPNPKGSTVTRSWIAC